MPAPLASTRCGLSSLRRGCRCWARGPWRRSSPGSGRTAPPICRPPAPIARRFIAGGNRRLTQIRGVPGLSGRPKIHSDRSKCPLRGACHERTVRVRRCGTVREMKGRTLMLTARELDATLAGARRSALPHQSWNSSTIPSVLAMLPLRIYAACVHACAIGYLAKIASVRLKALSIDASGAIPLFMTSSMAILKTCSALTEAIAGLNAS